MFLGKFTTSEIGLTTMKELVNDAANRPDIHGLIIVILTHDYFRWSIIARWHWGWHFSRCLSSKDGLLLEILTYALLEQLFLFNSLFRVCRKRVIIYALSLLLADVLAASVIHANVQGNCSWDAEIAYFYLTVLRYEDVRWLQISVHNIWSVNEANSAKKVVDQNDDLLFIENDCSLSCGFKQCLQIVADIIHDEKNGYLRIGIHIDLVEIVKSYDLSKNGSKHIIFDFWEMLHNFYLPCNFAYLILVCKIQFDHLDCDTGPVQFTFRSSYFAKWALTNTFLELVLILYLVPLFLVFIR